MLNFPEPKHSDVVAEIATKKDLGMTRQNGISFRDEIGEAGKSVAVTDRAGVSVWCRRVGYN